MLTECPRTANTGRNDPEHAVRGPGQPPWRLLAKLPARAPRQGRSSTGERGPSAGVTKQLIPQGPENRSQVTPEEPHRKISRQVPGTLDATTQRDEHASRRQQPG